MLSVFLTLALVFGCSCYPSGAPESACLTMTPSHGVPPQNTSSPYVIQFSSSNFSMDSNFTVTISSKDGNTSFKGFLVEVFTDQPTPSQLKESEFKVPENAHPTCNGGATHSDAKEKHMIGLQWQPTTSFTGKVKFRATIVQAYTVIWKNVESEYLSVDYTAPSTSPSDVTTISHPISTTSESPSDLPRCEPGFGCFKACPLTTCESVVMWRRSGNFVDFKIVARLERPNNRWVAIGFSPTGRMPKTSVIMCLVDNGQISVEEGINKGYSFGPLSNKTQGLTNISASVVDSVLRCTFSRQINVSGSVESIIYSLTKKYFLLLGDGPIIGGTPNQHEKTPVKSESRVDFLVNENVGSDDPSMTLYKLHGSLMILSWMFLSSVAIITARYYKSEWRGMMPCGVKVWFAIHRTMMSMVFIITTAAFIIIFIQVGSLLQETEGDIYVRYHPALGITVMGLCIANPIMAFFRCDPGHKYRHVFHYSHMFVGTAAQILSAITIYFGVNLEKSNTPEEASYIVIAYIITYVIIEVILECQKYNSRNEDKTETQILLRSTSNVPQQKSQTHQVNSFKLTVLTIHFVCMFMYCMVLIFFVATA